MQPIVTNVAWSVCLGNNCEPYRNGLTDLGAVLIWTQVELCVRWCTDLMGRGTIRGHTWPVRTCQQSTYAV